jgi:beta-glucosidase
MSDVETPLHDRDIDPVPSPAESEMSHSTPNTEFSPPTSPPQNVKRLMQDTRLSARKKLAELNLEEKVGAYMEHLLCTG